MKVLQANPIIVLTVLIILTSCQQHHKISQASQEASSSSSVMKKLFSIDTDESFYITFPDHKNQVKLTGFTEIATNEDRKPYLKGVLSHNKNYVAWLDYTNITALNISNDKNVFKFVAPYILTNSSSTSDNKHFDLDHPKLPSNSLYLGAFELDYHTNNINQYGQQLLGKYSSLDAIDYDGKKTVHITVRQYPTQTDQDKKINFSIHKLVFDVDKVITLIDETAVE